MKLVWILGLAVLAGCGRVEDVRFETRELPWEEIVSMGYDRAAEEETGDRLARKMAVPGNEAALINAAAGVLHKLITPGEAKMAATLIGQAVPPKVAVFDLTAGKDDFKVYEKKVTSTLGASLVKMHYKIAFQYGARHRGKGAFITNVKFVPLKVETDPFWSAGATAVSDEPVNVGTAAAPVAKLGFAITFSAKGIGTKTVTDEFVLEGKEGKLKESLREFDAKARSDGNL